MPLTNDDLDQTFRGITMPACDLQEFTDGLTTEERRLLAEQCERIATHAGFVAKYIEERYGYGCGDQGHEDALKAANKARQR